MTSMNGTKVLVTGGATKEIFDKARHIANRSRSEDHGHKVATELAKQGAEVTLITAETLLAKPEGVTVIEAKNDGTKITSTDDLKEVLDSQLGIWFNSIINLAVTPSVKPTEIKKEKMKRDKKSGKPESISIKGNLDLLSYIAGRAQGKQAVVGYDKKQNLLNPNGDDSLRELIESQKAKGVIATETINSKPQASQRLAGKKILVTGGRTEEQISKSADVITNFSTGRQGHSIAQALADMGAEVILVTGPSVVKDLTDPKIKTIHVNSTTELRDICVQQLPVDAAVCVSAVADFGLSTIPDLNLSETEKMDLVLDQMPDTLKTIGWHDQRPKVVIGFAAETQNIIPYAQDKVSSKNADIIVANDIGDPMIARGVNQNKVYLVSKDRVEELDEMSKYDVGLNLGEKIADLLNIS